MLCNRTGRDESQSTGGSRGGGGGLGGMIAADVAGAATGVVMTGAATTGAATWAEREPEGGGVPGLPVFNTSTLSPSISWKIGVLRSTMGLTSSRSD
jgi:hypothetical protein